MLSEHSNDIQCFSKLKDICRDIMAHPIGSPYRTSEICLQIPSSYSEEQKLGYHRDCYQCFTGNLNRLISEECLSTSRSQGNKSNIGIIFAAKCIFCDKGGKYEVKTKGAQSAEQLAKYKFGGGKTVLHSVESKNDYSLLTLLR